MKKSMSLAAHCLFAAAAVACALAIALHAPGPEVPGTAPSAPDTGYLDCARVLSTRAVEPDLVALCSMVAVVAANAAS